MENQLYCRLDDTLKIVEYPVYTIHIINRGYPFEWYTPVYSSPLPNITEYQSIISTPQVMIDHNGKPYVTLQHSTHRKPYDALVKLLPENDNEIDLGSDLVKEIKAEVTVRVQARLDNFAATKGYGDERTAPIEGAAKFAIGDDPKFGPEGRYCVKRAGETWRSLYTYMEQVMLGTAPFPREFKTVEENLPTLSWDEVDYSQ